MTDDRGRKRDTPNGLGPDKGPGRQVPRGAGLSGNLPAGSRFASHEPKPGSTPVSIQNEPRRDPRREHDVPAVGGGWDAGQSPARRPAQEPPMAAPRGQVPASKPTGRIDGLAATQPAEVAGARSFAPAGGGRPPERAGASSPRPPDPKHNLRLKLDGDTLYEAREARVKVPKRHAPILIGVSIVIVMVVGGSFLWIDANGGIDNFVTQLERLWDPDSAKLAPEQAAAVPGVATQAPATAQAPAAQPSAAPSSGAAQTGGPPEATGQQPPATPPPAAANNAQVATGELEAPGEASAGEAQPPAAAKPPAAAEPPAAAKPKPVAKPAPKPVAKRPIHRDPVLRVKPLGDVLNAAPPDPEGHEVWTPPPPPAPE